MVVGVIILNVYLPTLKILRLLIILHLPLVGRLELFFFLEQVFSTLTLFAFLTKKRWEWDLNPPANAGDIGSVPGPGRSTGYGPTKLITTTTEPELWGPHAATTEASKPRGP